MQITRLHSSGIAFVNNGGKGAGDGGGFGVLTLVMGSSAEHATPSRRSKNEGGKEVYEVIFPSFINK
ncbi:hypothetical protein E2C01_078881 [Portunus trituberculatus]|uniref:Uncharacterized protein n=1 Tax=Portunus trituberculatus TaxID=210409 RepID=A0A5B7IP08_PORTR|nr:hypothetical protein [Portunus trituberculatus]